MTIADLWFMTMNNPDLSVKWAAIGILLQTIQTVFIIVSATVVYFQIRQIQKEAIEKKIIGLKMAVEPLDSDLFNQVSKEVATGRDVRGVNWRKLFNSINLVALFVQEGFTNYQLLFAMKGKELFAVGNYIKKKGLPDELKDDQENQYKPAIKFLNDICDHAKKIGYIE